MTDAQTWTLIAVFATAFGLMIVLVLRILATSIEAVRAEIGGLRGEVRAEIGGLRGEMNAKLDSLDRDVQAITRRVFGTDA